MRRDLREDRHRRRRRRRLHDRLRLPGPRRRHARRPATTSTRRRCGAEVLDLNHGLQFVPMAHVEGSDDVAVLRRGADVVVVTAGAKQKHGQTRIDLAASTTSMLRTLMPDLVEAAPDARLPARHQPRRRHHVRRPEAHRPPGTEVFGTGTVLDSFAAPRPDRGALRRRGPERPRLRRRRARRQRDPAVEQRQHRRTCPSPTWWRPTSGTRWPPRWWARPTRSSRARAPPTTPSASPAAGSSRRCCATRSGCCRSPRCCPTTTASATSASPCPRWSGQVAPSGGSRSR